MFAIIQAITISTIVNTAIAISAVSALFYGLKKLSKKEKGKVVSMSETIVLDEFEIEIS